jgi:hypothetical protein
MPPPPDPATDDEDRSKARIDECRAALLADANDVLRERPDLRLVGFVIEPDAPEMILIRQILPANRTPPNSGFVGVVERALAVRILGVVAPALLDWLEAGDGVALRSLPVVYLARTGMRTATLRWLAGA